MSSPCELIFVTITQGESVKQHPIAVFTRVMLKAHRYKWIWDIAVFADMDLST